MPNFSRHDPKQHERLKQVLALQGSARWRAAANFYLWLNPKHYDAEKGVFTEDARMENRHIIATNAAVRESLADENFGKFNETEGSRYALRMPANMLKFIQMIQPDLFEGPPQERKDNLHKLMKEFPEYRIAKKV